MKRLEEIKNQYLQLYEYRECPDCADLENSPECEKCGGEGNVRYKCGEISISNLIEIIGDAHDGK